MQLYIMRHGDAVDVRTVRSGRDGERPLSAEGQVEVQAVAAGLQRLGLAFDLLLTSPLLRARQTADLLVTTGGVAQEPVVCPALVPEGDLYDVLMATRGGTRVMLVGHMPLLGALIGWLVWGDPDLALPLRTAGLCRIDLADSARPGDGELRWFLPPRLAGRLR